MSVRAAVHTYGRRSEEVFDDLADCAIAAWDACEWNTAYFDSAVDDDGTFYDRNTLMDIGEEFHKDFRELLTGPADQIEATLQRVLQRKAAPLDRTNT